MKKQNRRDFIKLSAMSAGFLGLSAGKLYAREDLQEQLDRVTDIPRAAGSPVTDLRVDPIEQVRVGIIGVGNRGYGHVGTINALAPKAKIVAICDVRENRVKRALDLLESLNGKKPKVATYSGSKDAWKEMVKRDDLDLVVVVTPPPDHAPMAIYAMQQGKHVVSEVPIALTFDECWGLVNTAEETQRHCMMLENVCYGEEELWVLNMVKSGVFGTLTYAEAGYLHHLLEKLFIANEDPELYGYYNQWRLRLHARYNGNLYPTHGLGPVANYMGVGRGDRFDSLVSMSSPEASLHEYSPKSPPDNAFYNHKEFAHGDLNSSMIKTHKGRMIILKHDVVSPRPYSRINLLAGTRAYHEGYPSRLSLYDEERGHVWLDEKKFKEMRENYEHPLWKKMKTEAEKNGGHGGIDYIEFYRLINNLNRGLPMDMDVYDGVNWSVIVPLSRLSVELGSVPVKFPDFMRGKWKEERELGVYKYLY